MPGEGLRLIDYVQDQHQHHETSPTPKPREEEILKRTIYLIFLVEFLLLLGHDGSTCELGLGLELELGLGLGLGLGLNQHNTTLT